MVVEPAELRDQPCLADARLAEHGDELGPPRCDDAAERRLQVLELRAAADQGRVQAAVDGRCVRLQTVQRDRVARPPLARGRVPHELPGRRRHADLVGVGVARQRLRDHDGLAHRGRAAAARVQHDVAGRHADLREGADLQRRDAVAHVNCAAQRAQRVVLERHGMPEQGQQAVVAQLDHGAAVGRARRGHRVVHAVEGGQDRLGIRARDAVRLLLADGGELREDAGHTSAVVLRGRCRRGRHDVGHLLAQDRPLQGAQLRRRLQPEPVQQRRAGSAERVERVGLATGAVEGEHQLAAQRLVEGMRVDERLQLVEHLRVEPAGEVGLDALPHGADAQRVEPARLLPREGRVPHVRQRRPPPQVEGVAQRRGRLHGLATRELRPAAPHERREAIGVDRVRRHVEHVPSGTRDDGARADGSPQAGGHDVDRVVLALRPVGAPELVQDPVERHDLAAMHRQQR